MPTLYICQFCELRAARKLSQVGTQGHRQPTSPPTHNARAQLPTASRAFRAEIGCVPKAGRRRSPSQHDDILLSFENGTAMVTSLHHANRLYEQRPRGLHPYCRLLVDPRGDGALQETMGECRRQQEWHKHAPPAGPNTKCVQQKGGAFRCARRSSGCRWRTPGTRGRSRAGRTQRRRSRG